MIRNVKKVFKIEIESDSEGGECITRSPLSKGRAYRISRNIKIKPMEKFSCGVGGAYFRTSFVQRSNTPFRLVRICNTLSIFGVPSFSFFLFLFERKSCKEQKEK